MLHPIKVLTIVPSLYLAVLRLARREPRRLPAVGHDVRQLSQTAGLHHRRQDAREAADGKLVRHIQYCIQ